MSEFKPRNLSDLRERTDQLFDPNSGYLDTVGGASRLSSGIGSSEALRASNLNTNKSRFSLPDSVKAGVGLLNNSRQTTPNSNTGSEPDIATQYRNISNADLERVRGLDNQELQSNINRVKQYEPLANNEANRAYGMKLDNDNRALGNQLTTQFPYKKYENESASAREIMSNSLSAIPTFLNRATASRLSPVSLSL